MRTSHRNPVARPLHRTAIASALALAFGAFDAHALNQTVPSVTSPTMSEAIANANLDYATRVAIDSTATCAGDEIVVDGSGGFVVAESAPLPTLICPGITIRGTGDGTYGGRISGMNSFVYGGCGLSVGAITNIDSMVIDGFSNGPGLCGPFGSINNSNLNGNFYGLQGSVASFTANAVFSNTYGLDLHNTRSVIGGASPAARNAIYGNGTGIAVEYGGSADIGFNYIGTFDGIAAYGGNDTGITLFGIASTVHDNLISANHNVGVEVNDDGGSSISNNTIGLDVNGTSSLDNGQGILAYSSVTIDGNIVSGNTYNIEMHGSGAVTNNLIGGMDAGGSSPIWNAVTGVLSLGSSPPFVGGNLIAGAQYPIEFDNASGGTIQGNRIGLDKSGAPVTGEIAQYVGISVYCSSSVTITGSNIVGAMSEAGIGLYESFANTISGNFIGVANDGKTPLGNTGAGVQIGGGGCLASLATGKRAAGAPATAIRTLSAGNNTIQSNVIAFNGNSGIQIQAGAGSSGNQIVNNTITGNGTPGTGSGVSIEDNGSVSNSITGNAIYGNSPKNINLNTVDPTLPLLNDAGDVDTGPNDGLNYPEITAVRQDGTSTSIDFNMNVPAASGAYYVQFFSNSTASPGGQSYVGFMDVTASGVQSFSKTFSGTYDNISATSTVTAPVAGTSSGDTSEFSPVIGSTRMPALVVSPTSFNFGNIEAGATSATSTTFTLQSAGASSWTLFTFLTTGVCGDIPSVPLNCSGSGFICSTDCVYGSPIVPGGACTVTASFAPQTTGPSNLNITICDNTATAPQAIQLSGNGTLPPPLTITPNGQNFGNVVVGSSSGAQTFTLTNPAKTDVTLAAPSATAPFAVTGTTCTATLTAGSSCTVSVVFTPATAGVASGQLNVPFTSTATGSSVTLPLAAALAGVGVATVQLTMPASVDVGTYIIGLVPPTATATVKNTGTAAVPITSITPSGPFTTTHDCGASLAPNLSCTITIALASTNVGPVTGNVTVVTPAGSQLIALTGTVAPAAIKLVPSQVDFGLVLVHKNASRDIVATNTTGTNVSLGTPTVSGPFTIASSTCGTFVGANGICTITVNFAPQRSGPASGALALNFGVNAALGAASAPVKRGAKAAATTGATAVAPLTGGGIDAAALDMTTLVEFGTYIVGSAPLVRTVTLTSSGNAVVTFQEISASGPFGLSSDCPLNLAPGESCTLTITYSSSTLGAAAGLVTIRSNAIGGLRTISLGALTQLKPVPIVEVSPSTISFGNRLIGTQSPPVRVTVQNSGGASAILGPLTISSDYVIVSTTCGTSLEAQAACTADVAMRPVGFGARPGAFSFTSNADGSPHSVGLGGNGCRPPGVTLNRGTSPDSCAP